MKKRPDFLTVLCILTWVGSGIVLIGQLITLATASFTKELTDIAEEGMDEAMEEFAEEAPEFGSLFSNIMGQSIHALEHLTELALVRIFGVLLVLAGSLMMWNLKKTGYYLFIAGKVIIIGGILIILGASAIGMMSIIGPLIVAIAFIAMYGANLKAMN